MKKWLFMLSALMLGAIVVATDADAARLGGGRSVGAQRNVTAPPASTPAKPAQAQPAQGQQQPVQQGSKWGMLGGILGGLALGGLLAWALSGTGLSTILLVALLAVVAVMALRALRRREAPAPENVQFAGMSGSERVSLPLRTASIGALHAPSTLPAGFDAAGFERIAKMIFIRMQAANDSGDLNDLRAFTTPEMCASLRVDLQERGASSQTTDVVRIDAEVLDVETEGASQVVSVRFHGLIREEKDGVAAPFDEVWHLVKPLDGSREWAIAGVQQMA